MVDWRPSLLQHMPKLQRCCNIKEACLRIAAIFHTALWGQDAFYIWVRTQEVIIFLSAWGRFSCFPFSNIRARRTCFCFHGASFPLLKTEVSRQTDLLKSIVTLKNASSHFFSAMMFPVHPGSGLLPHAWDVWTTRLCSALWIISRNTRFYEPKGLLIVCPLNTSPDAGTECPVVCHLDSNTYCMVPF